MVKPKIVQAWVVGEHLIPLEIAAYLTEHAVVPWLGSVIVDEGGDGFPVVMNRSMFDELYEWV